MDMGVSVHSYLLFIRYIQIKHALDIRWTERYKYE